jgi:hypothetical protein
MQQLMARIELESFHPNLSDDAAPECVVAVGNDDLADRGQLAVHVARHDRGEDVEVRSGVGDVRDVLPQRVVNFRFVHAVGAMQASHGHHGQSGQSCKRARQLLLARLKEFLDLPRPTAVGRAEDEQGINVPLGPMALYGALEIAARFR